MRKQKKILAVLLSLIFTISLWMVPSYTPKAAETTEESQTDQEKKRDYKNTMYKWTKAKSLDDLPQNTEVGEDGWVPVVFVSYAYNHNSFKNLECHSHILYSKGNYKDWGERHDFWNACEAPQVNTNPQIPLEKKDGHDVVPDVFVTKGNLQCIWMKFADRKGRSDFKDDYMKRAHTTKKDCALNRYYFSGSNEDGTRGDTILCYNEVSMGYDYAGFYAPDDGTEGLLKEWYVTTDSTEGSLFHFFVDVSVWSDGCLAMNESGDEWQVTDWDWENDLTYFDVYVGEPMDDQITTPSKTVMTLEPGTTNNFSGTYRIPEGETMEVGEDALLIVSGRIINEGTILNKGIIMIKDGGSIFSIDNKKGIIDNQGGDILIKNTGYLQATQGFKMKNSTLINKGLLVVGGEINIQDSIIENDGSSYFGYGLQNNINLFVIDKQQYDPYAALMARSKTGWACQVDATCYTLNNVWHNYKKPNVKSGLNGIPQSIAD